jgi:hypothetical protein
MSRLGWIVSLLLWTAATTVGLWKGLEYDSTAASVAAPPVQWPDGCALTLDRERPTLLVFVHPKCPCTRATIRELDRFLVRYRNRITVRIIILEPDNPSLDWDQSPLLTEIAAIRAAQSFRDHGGSFRRQFYASTSGECLLYNAQGQLLFHGGLTTLRGHEGPSVGQEAIAAVISGKSPTTRSAPVFGCPFETPLTK